MRGMPTGTQRKRSRRWSLNLIHDVLTDREMDVLASMPRFTVVLTQSRIQVFRSSNQSRGVEIDGASLDDVLDLLPSTPEHLTFNSKNLEIPPLLSFNPD